MCCFAGFFPTNQGIITNNPVFSYIITLMWTAHLGMWGGGLGVAFHAPHSVHLLGT